MKRKGGGSLLGERYIALDAGSHSIKVLLLESRWGRIRYVAHQVINLREEGILSGEELRHQLRAVLQSLGRHPVVLCLPQPMVVNQVLDLPHSQAHEEDRWIEEEIAKLSGLSQTALIHDEVRLQPFGKYKHPCWVTFCRESEVQGEIERLGLAPEQVWEVTTPAASLVAAWTAGDPGDEPTLLVELGSSQTTVVVIVKSQAVAATSFPMGSDTFTEAIASYDNSPWEVAETFKHRTDLTTASSLIPALRERVEQWRQEVERTVGEWLAEHADLGLRFDRFQIALSGGGAAQNGLDEHLRQHGWQLIGWPAVADTHLPKDFLSRYAVVFGAGLHAFERAPQPVSLLPETVRTAWRREQAVEWTYGVCAVAIVVAALLLGLSTWQKKVLLRHKQALFAEANQSLQLALKTESQARRLWEEYEQWRPVLQGQRRTLDTLQALAALREVKDDKSFWFVLFADQESYFTAPEFSATNAPTATNTAASPTEWPMVGFSPLKPGFIAEVCVPESGEKLRQTLSGIVNELKSHPAFSHVDSLAEDQRRKLADPRVTVTNKLFTLSLELGPESLEQVPEAPAPPAPVPPKRKPASGRTERAPGPRSANDSGSPISSTPPPPPAC